MPQIVYNNITAGKRLIGPSVQEGEMGISSLIVRPLTGHRAAVPLNRMPPTIIQPPTVSGRSVIPAVLTAFPGVYEASPQPTFTYEWLRDGEPFVNDSLTYITQESDNNKEISVRVTASSPLGQIITTSNSITAVLLESLNFIEYEHYYVSGMGQDNRIHTMNLDYVYITGMAQDFAEINATFTSYYISGMGQDDTAISSQAELYIITEEAP